MASEICRRGNPKLKSQVTFIRNPNRAPIGAWIHLAITTRRIVQIGLNHYTKGEGPVSDIKFLVDQVDEPAGLGMLQTASSKALDIVVGIAADGFKNMLASVVRQMADAISAVDMQNSPFDLSEVTFTVNVGANGELSIVSLMKGSISPSSGIQLKLVRKKPTNG